MTRSARVEVVAGGSVIGVSDWIAVPPGTNTVADLTLTAAPGIYVARLLSLPSAGRATASPFL